MTTVIVTQKTVERLCEFVTGEENEKQCRTQIPTMIHKDKVKDN